MQTAKINLSLRASTEHKNQAIGILIHIKHKQQFKKCYYHQQQSRMIFQSLDFQEPESMTVNGRNLKVLKMKSHMQNIHNMLVRVWKTKLTKLQLSLYLIEKVANSKLLPVDQIGTHQILNRAPGNLRNTQDFIRLQSKGKILVEHMQLHLETILLSNIILNLCKKLIKSNTESIFKTLWNQLILVYLDSTVSTIAKHHLQEKADKETCQK